MNLTDLQIETPRLLLRVPRLDDLDEWARMMADEEAAKFIGGVMAPRSTTWRGLMTMIGALARHGLWDVLGDREIQRTLGGPARSVDARRLAGPRSGLGDLRVTAGGAAMPPKARSAATNWAFDHLGWDRVIHSIDPANIASQMVARKLGSQNLGPGQLPAPFQEARVDIWGQSREEWRRRHS